MDADVRAGLDRAGSLVPPTPVLIVGDWAGRRAAFDAEAAVIAPWQAVDDTAVSRTEVTVRHGNRSVAARWYEHGHPTGAAAPYIHGGGMLSGSVDLYDPIVAAYVATTRVSMLSVAYRLAPEARFPEPLTDCADALEWLVEHASSLGVDPARVAVNGGQRRGRAGRVCVTWCATPAARRSLARS